jgi:hypothetical protein
MEACLNTRSEAFGKSRFAYYCYGFRILSDVRIGGLGHVAEPRPAVGDLRIEIKRSDAIEFASLVTGYSLTAPDTIALHLPDVATFLIQDGERIRVFPCSGIGPEDIRPYLLGSAIGAAMHQRGMLPLHASSVRTARGVVAFSAPCGYGKSTIAAGLWQRGLDMLSDDILALNQNAPGQFACMRGVPALKLLPDAAARLESSSLAHKEFNNITGKYYISTEGSDIAESLPLWRLYFLRDGNEISIRKLSGADSMAYAVSNIFRAELIRMLSAQRRLLPQIASVVSGTNCFSLERPPKGDPDQLVRAVEQHIADAG